MAVTPSGSVCTECFGFTPNGMILSVVRLCARHERAEALLTLIEQIAADKIAEDKAACDA